MNYPTDLMPVCDAINAYGGAPEETAEAYLKAVMNPVPPMKVADAFEALKEHIDVLDQDGLKVLAGCAYVLNMHNFRQLKEQAIPVMLAVTPLLAV